MINESEKKKKLATGKGASPLGVVSYYSKTEKAALRALAKREGRSIRAQVRHLVTEGLKAATEGGAA